MNRTRQWRRANVRVALPSAAGRALAIWLAASSCATLAGCIGGAARQAGRGAAEEAVESLREQTSRPPARATAPGERAEPGAPGAAAGLTQSEPPISQGVADIVAGALWRAAGREPAPLVPQAAQPSPAAPPAPPSLAPPEAPSAAAGGSPVQAVAREAGKGVSRELAAELGANGEGPLAQSLAATTGLMSVAAMRGTLDVLFPECQGADPSPCLERKTAQMQEGLSDSISTGVKQGIGWKPSLAGFMMGLLTAAVITQTVRLRRLGADRRRERSGG